MQGDTFAQRAAGLAEWCEEAREGCAAAVYIKSIIPEKMKIKLVIVGVSENADCVEPVKSVSDAKHIDFWKYSPDGCIKEIVSVFE